MTSLNTLGIKSGVGGAFHAGIEVDGLEWSFGHSESGTGMHAVEPREVRAWHQGAGMREVPEPCTWKALGVQMCGRHRGLAHIRHWGAGMREVPEPLQGEG
eukprot:360255-Chlamydomonas_euryale.AAC.4